MKKMDKEAISQYITVLVLTFIEGAVFLFAGIRLMNITQWMPLMSGTALMLAGLTSFIGVGCMLYDKRLVKEYADALEDDKKLGDVDVTSTKEE